MKKKKSSHKQNKNKKKILIRVYYMISIFLTFFLLALPLHCTDL